VPVSALDSIGPAFQHTRQQLLQPFRISQWAKLALVGFLAGELTSGGCSTSFNVPTHSTPTGSDRLLALPQLPPLNPALYAALIASVIVAVVVLWVLFIYVSSVMRFVLFDSVIAKYCEIRQSWHRRQGPGMRLFGWEIAVSLCTFALLGIVIGIPLAVAFAAGWFKNSGAHLALLILFGMFLFLVAAGVVLIALLVHVFTKDFVVPQMALEEISALQGWRRLLPMIKAQKGSYAGYVGMKFLMTLGAAVMVGIVSTIVIIVMLIPVGGIGAAIVLGGKAVGLTWNLYTITLAVVAGAILLLLVLYAISFVSVPTIVFFPAYSLYFFASRYPALHAVLYPAPPPEVPPIAPALPPAPEPIG